MVIRRITEAFKKDSVEDWASSIEAGFVSLLNSWRVWCGDDELRALHIGLHSSNPELSVSLLTDREPYLEESGLEALGEPWPTADWRLTGIANEDASLPSFLAWLGKCSSSQKSDEKLLSLFFEIVTSQKVLAQIGRFRKVKTPLPLRVENLETGSVLEFTLQELVAPPHASAEERAVLSAMLLEAFRYEQKKSYGEAIAILQRFVEKDPHAELVRIASDQIKKLQAKQNATTS